MSRKMNMHYLILFAYFAAKLPFLRGERLKLVFPLHEFTVKNNKILHRYVPYNCQRNMNFHLPRNPVSSSSWDVIVENTLSRLHFRWRISSMVWRNCIFPCLSILIFMLVSLISSSTLSLACHLQCDVLFLHTYDYIHWNVKWIFITSASCCIDCIAPNSSSLLVSSSIEVFFTWNKGTRDIWLTCV